MPVEPQAPREGSESDEEQASLLGAEGLSEASGDDSGNRTTASSSDGDTSQRSIYAPAEDDGQPDACKVIVSLIPIVYAPSLLYSLGEAITDPVLLLYATDTLGTSVSTAAFAALKQPLAPLSRSLISIPPN